MWKWFLTFFSKIGWLVIYLLIWLCWLAGKSTMTPTIFMFSILQGCNSSFEVKTVETIFCAHSFGYRLCVGKWDKKFIGLQTKRFYYINVLSELFSAGPAKLANPKSFLLQIARIVFANPTLSHISLRWGHRRNASDYNKNESWKLWFYILYTHIQ